MANTERRPKVAAIMPPLNAPTDQPNARALPITPNAEPRFSVGTIRVKRTFKIGSSPPIKNTNKKLSNTNCQTLLTKTIEVTKSDPRSAQKTPILRNFPRSASVPMTIPAKTAAAPATEVTTPVRVASPESVETSS